MKKIILVVTLLAVSIVLSGCQTIAGLGKDLESTGEAITNAVE